MLVSDRCIDVCAQSDSQPLEIQKYPAGCCLSSDGAFVLGTLIYSLVVVQIAFAVVVFGAKLHGHNIWGGW